MKYLLMLAILLATGTSMAQSASFGIKGGFNYGATGAYENFSSVVGDASTIENGEDKTGYHLGFYGKLELMGIFLQPELLYTRLRTEDIS